MGLTAFNRARRQAEAEGGEMLADIVSAIAQLDPNDPAHWTKTKKPDIKVLSKLLGRVIAAADRDAAFLIYQSDDVGANSDDGETA